MAKAPHERATDGQGLIGVAQAADLLGVHPNTIRAWTDAGRLTAYRINARGDRRFRRADVERVLTEGGADMAALITSPPPVARRDAELAVLTRVARESASRPRAAAIGRSAVEALRQELGVERVAVYVAGDPGLRLETHAGFEAPPHALLPESFAPSDDPAPMPFEDGLRIQLPLRSSRDLLGALVIEGSDGGPLAELRPIFLRSLAGVLASALQSARLLARARREVQRGEALRAVTHELVGQLELGALLDEIVERTRSLFEADKAGLWLLNEGDHPFAVAAQHGLGEAFLAQVRKLTLRSDTIGVRAILDRRPYWIRDADRRDGAGLMRQVYAAEGIRTVCLVPLFTRDEAIGLLGLYHARDRSWPDDEVALAQAFANQGAVAIQNARLYRSTAEQAARMKSIQDLSTRLNRLTDVRAIGEAIVAEASAIADYSDIRVYQVDWDRRVCEPIAYTRDLLGEQAADVVDRLRLAIGEGFTGWAVEHGEPLLINDALHDERGKTIEGTDDIEESLLVVPMLYEGRAAGVIVLSQLGFNRFDADDLQTMSIFASQAAQAMANADAYARLAAQSSALERQLDLQRRMLEINHRLLTALDHESVLETIADGLRSVVAYDSLAIYRVDREARVLRPVLARDRHAAEIMQHVIPFGRGIMGWAVEHAEPVRANDALNDPRAIQIPGTPPDPEALVMMPLLADGQVIGAMNVARIGGEEVHFSDLDFELVQLFAGQASIALRNADEHQAMSHRAETDALTGLGNHGAFQRDLGELLAQADAGGANAVTRVGMLMMDLDNFKAFNDRHGHPAGDALLHAAGTAIYGAARSDDRVYRYGGDEFALILPGASVSHAARAAERIRRAVAALTVNNATPVTITIGVAGYPADATDRAGLVAAADTALYFGKRAGEDRVVRVAEVPREVLDLRGSLNQIARAALLHPGEEAAVDQFVAQASLLTGERVDADDAVRSALLTVSRSLDSRGVDTRSHADRVARLAVRVGARISVPASTLRTVELSARLHALDGDGLAQLDAIPSMRAVASLIRAQRAVMARADSPSKRTTRATGSRAAHVTAAANAYDEMVTGIGRQRIGRSEAMATLRSHPAGFRTDVLDALADLVSDRPDRGRRRRDADIPDEAFGAA